MELCSSCMGHRRNIITFLVSPRLKKECMAFLLKEMRIPNCPEQFTENGPVYYKVSHQCRIKPVPPIPPPRPPLYTPRDSSTFSSDLPSYYNEAELAVLQDSKSAPTQFQSQPWGIPLHTHDTRLEHDTDGVFETQPDAGQTRNQPPPLPSRTQPRPNFERNTPASLSPQPYLKCHTSFSRGPVQEDSDSLFTMPYQISHRIYITDTGHVTREPQIFGSGGGEVRRRKVKPPVPPPREVIKLTPPRSCQTVPATHGDFPCPKPLVPLSTDTPNASRQSPQFSKTRRSWSDSEAVVGCNGSGNWHFARRSSEFKPVEEDDEYITARRQAPPSLPPPPLPPKMHTQTHEEVFSHSPSSPLCVNDLNDVSVVTELTFVHPPTRPPKPKPRSKTLYSEPVAQRDAARAVLSAMQAGMAGNAAVSTKRPVPIPRKRTHTQEETTEYRGSHSAHSSPVLPRRPASMERSLSSGSLSSDDIRHVL